MSDRAMPDRNTPILYEWLDGIEALTRLTTRFYEHVKKHGLRDPTSEK